VDWTGGVVATTPEAPSGSEGPAAGFATTTETSPAELADEVFIPAVDKLSVPLAHKNPKRACKAARRSYLLLDRLVSKRTPHIHT
jgi:hypothetical protein